MEPGTAAKPAPAEATPAFDVVRVEPDGSAAVVGTAEPGAKVTIYADEAPLAEAEADAEGNFVAIFKVEPSAEPRALTLGAVTPEGAASSSEEVVMLLPRAPGAPAGEQAPEADVARRRRRRLGDTRAGRRAGAGRARPGGAARGRRRRAAAEVAATVIVRKDSVEVAPADADGTRRVTLGAVSYAEGGEVTLAGAGTAGAVVRAYVDDRFAEEAQVAADGRWSMRLGDVAEGHLPAPHRRARRRTARWRAGSKRRSSATTRGRRRGGRGRPAGAAGPIVSVTVQPGHNLWTLARTHYGSGVRYTQIFTANRDQIRDPDLIYPGQIFNMPENAAE